MSWETFRKVTRIMTLFLASVMVLLSLTSCNRGADGKTENREEQLTGSEAESVNTMPDEPQDGIVAGSEEYSEDRERDLGKIQYAKIVFDNSAYTYPEEEYENMYHGKYELIVKRTDDTTQFDLEIQDVHVGEPPFIVNLELPNDTLDELQQVIVDHEMSRLDGYYMVDSALGEGFELNVRYDSGEQIWGYAEGGYSVMPKKYWDEKWILAYIQKTLNGEGLSLTMAPEPVEYVIQNPGWDYYYNGKTEDNTVHTYISLKEVSAEENDIIDEDEWFSYIGRTQPQWDNKSDDFYRYELYGGDNFYPCVVSVYDINTDDCLYIIDMSDFTRPELVAQGDESFVYEFIRDIRYADGVFYLIVTHSTYAESAPQNAYIVALDANDDFKVLWKTEPLTCNSHNLAIVGDSIICGYGFTAEPDYMYILDKYTGKRVARYDLRTGPDYFYVSEDETCLYVRTYNMNYEYLIMGN